MNMLEARVEARRRWGVRSFAKKTRAGWFLVGRRVDFPTLKMVMGDDVKGSSKTSWDEAFQRAMAKEVK